MTLAAIIALAVILWVLWRARGTLSLSDEERTLREYFKQRDAAERRGEIWP